MRISKYFFIILCTLSLTCVVTATYAQGGGSVATGTYSSSTTGIGKVAENVLGVFETLVNAIAAAAYVAGVGFAIGAIMKFKQHKDNPTQIPIGTPIALLFIAAALIFLPSLIKITSQTLFGEQGGTPGGPGGTGIRIIEQQGGGQ